VGWFNKYWDLVDDYYWDLGKLGIRAIPKRAIAQSQEATIIPNTFLNERGGALYRRVGSAAENLGHLHSDEVALNHALNFALAIASEEIVSDLIFSPFGFKPKSAIQSVDKDISTYFGWPRNDTLTQHDGFYVADDAAVGLEIKLDADSHSDQIAKYVFLLMNEELRAAQKKHLGLLYIVPESRVAYFRKKIEFPNATAAESFIHGVQTKPKLRKLDKLILEQRSAFEYAFKRLRIEVISWTNFHQSILNLVHEIPPLGPGNKSLRTLLLGLADAVEGHSGTEVAPDLIER